MAEYCSVCSPFNGEFDINVFKLALRLENGRSESFLCEGCNLRGVYKDDLGNLFLARSEDKEIKLHPILIEDLM